MSKKSFSDRNANWINWGEIVGETDPELTKSQYNKSRYARGSRALGYFASLRGICAEINAVTKWSVIQAELEGLPKAKAGEHLTDLLIDGLAVEPISLRALHELLKIHGNTLISLAKSLELKGACDVSETEKKLAKDLMSHTEPAMEKSGIYKLMYELELLLAEEEEEEDKGDGQG